MQISMTSTVPEPGTILHGVEKHISKQSDVEFTNSERIDNINTTS